MKTLQIADLFCGAGGSTAGIRQALDRMGLKANILAINHWKVAIKTHSANNPGVEHLCQSVDSIDPTKVVPGQELDLLWASPACTHHSVARGGPCSRKGKRGLIYERTPIKNHQDGN